MIAVLIIGGVIAVVAVGEGLVAIGFLFAASAADQAEAQPETETT